MTNLYPDIYIDTDTALKSTCERFGKSKWLTIDTEFVREKTYYAQPCLIQIGNTEQLACIDPIALSDLQPLKKLLCNPQITKVFHAAMQDMEIFYYLFDALPSPVFDTQLAGALLGYGEQIGYASLVKNILNVDLDKSHSRTDWSYRPLDEKQLQYAIDDVRYLRDLYAKLHQQLSKMGRLDWLQKDLDKLTDVATYKPTPEKAWQRVKNVNRLKGIQLNVLKHLARWREQCAMEKNQPRKWVLSDMALLNLAQQMPANSAELERLRYLDNKSRQSYASILLTLIKDAKAEDRKHWPQIMIPKKPSGEQEALADMMLAALRLKASEHNISATMLATRDEINKLAQGINDIPLLSGWRREIAGNTIIELLEGRLALSYTNGQPKLIPQ